MEQERDILQLFKGQLIKVVYKDGEKISSLHGDLIESNTEFIVIQTHKQQVAINRRNIQKMNVNKLPSKEELEQIGASVTKK